MPEYSLTGSSDLRPTYLGSEIGPSRPCVNRPLRPIFARSLPTLSLHILSVSAITLLAITAATGCASPGPPRAPSLHLPTLATGLKAVRIGPAVNVTWTTPPNTIDGDANRPGMTAILCREIVSSRSTPCKEIARVGISSGPSHAGEILPVALTQGPPALLAYRVALLNSRGRSAGQTTPVYAAAGEAPAPLGPFAIAPSPGGALITWPSIPGQPPVELQRVLAGAPTTSVKAKPGNPEMATLFQPSPRNPGTVAFVASRNGADPGGVLDSSVVELQQYTYTGQRVRRVELSGHYLEIRGMSSPPATFLQLDAFPPTAPSGLVSIPSGGYGTPLSIDLSWEPSPERDLLGYVIYRSDSSRPFVRINPQPVSAPAFRDLSIASGIPYAYRITAVDQHHNESAPGPEIHETIPADQKP